MTRFFRTSMMVAAAMAVGGLGGCAEKGATMNDRPAMTEAQATARVEELVRQGVDGIDPKPRLSLFPTSLAEHPCIPNEGNVSTGEIYINRSFYLKGLPKDRLAEAGLKIKENWEKAGHRFTTSHGFDKGEPRLWGVTGDEFDLSLSTAATMEITLTVNSPCFRPVSSPSPSTAP